MRHGSLSIPTRVELGIPGQLAETNNNKHIEKAIQMKKAIISLLALAGGASAFENLHLTFEDTLGEDFTWKNLGESTSTPIYVDSGLEGYGKALVLDKTGFVTTTGDYKSITSAGENEGSFTLVTTLKIASWAEYGGSENRIYIFGSGDKWEGLGLSATADSLSVTTKGKTHTETSYSLTLDTWYTLALTYDATNNNATFYVDGTSVGSVTVPTAVNQPGVGLGIGNGAKDWTTGPWAGQIADFQLLNSALTADQVAAYGAPTPVVPEPTTATLSLLALAGLAARRRRK